LDSTGSSAGCNELSGSTKSGIFPNRLKELTSQCVMFSMGLVVTIREVKKILSSGM
jgi:hypothetical protein